VRPAATKAIIACATQKGRAPASEWTADADEFARGLLVLRGEHHPESRDYNIEARVRKGQGFRVCFLKRYRQALGLGPLAPASEQRADIGRRYDIGKASRRGERYIAIAGRNVEEALVAAQVDGLAERLADDL
jgi:hypothetical protein